MALPIISTHMFYSLIIFQLVMEVLRYACIHPHIVITKQSTDWLITVVILIFILMYIRVTHWSYLMHVLHIK